MVPQTCGSESTRSNLFDQGVGHKPSACKRVEQRLRLCVIAHEHCYIGITSHPRLGSHRHCEATHNSEGRAL